MAPQTVTIAELDREMRGWVADCVWADIDPADVADLPRSVIVRGVARHYEGGVRAFIADCEELYA
jgi:hypothetical protein